MSLEKGERFLEKGRAVTRKEPTPTRKGLKVKDQGRQCLFTGIMSLGKDQRSTGMGKMSLEKGER